MHAGFESPASLHFPPVLQTRPTLANSWHARTGSYSPSVGITSRADSLVAAAGALFEGQSMAFTLSTNSKKRLQGVHKDLALVVVRALQLSKVDFAVVQGNRTQAEQDELYAQGRTKSGQKVTWTRNSRHIGGKAVDLAAFVEGKIDWNDLENYSRIAEAMKASAKELGIPIVWGGDWEKTKDRPHFELDREAYP